MAGRGGRAEVARLLAAERAARQAGERAARWWLDVDAAASARTERALDDLLRSTFSTMRDALDADALVLLVADEKGEELVARVAVGLAEEVGLEVGIRKGEGVAGRVLASRAPLVVDDLAKVEVASPALRHSGLTSLAAVPLTYRDRLLGVMYVGSRDLRRFVGDDVELLELLADRLAATVERVQAFEGERSARRRAEYDADRLSRLQSLASRLVTVASNEEVASALAASLGGDAPGQAVEAVEVWLVRGESLERVAAAPGASTGWPGTLATTGDWPPSRAAACRRLFYGEGGTEGPATPSALDGERPQRPAGHGSWAVLPLVVEDACLAVVAVTYPPGEHLDEGARAFLASVADQASHALARIRLHEQQLAQGAAAAFFARAAKSMAEASDLADALDRLAALALTAFGDVCLIDVVEDDGRLRRVAARHRDPSLQDAVERLRAEYPPLSSGPHPVADVVRSGRPRWTQQMSDTLLRSTTRDDAHYELTRDLEFRSYVSVPLVTEQATLGALTIVSADEPLGTDHVAFAERLADQVAAVVANARRYETTLQTSQILQHSLLPQRLPSVEGYELATRYLPATQGLEVGGDFYDVVELTPQQVVLAIGDVAGHDRQAAALMGHLRSAARTLAGEAATPAALIAALQRSWGLLEFDRMATGLFAQLDPGSGHLVIASAGHHPPLLVDEAGATFLPVAPSAPLGVPAAPATDWHGRLERGQLLLFYTDGAVEDRALPIDHGLEQLATAAAAGDLHPGAVCRRVVGSLPARRDDDVALLALRRAG